MSELKVGDIVQLKSGSQNMTVSEIFNETVVCVWFDEYSEVLPLKETEDVVMTKYGSCLNREKFVFGTLKKVKTEEDLKG